MSLIWSRTLRGLDIFSLLIIIIFPFPIHTLQLDFPFLFFFWAAWFAFRVLGLGHTLFGRTDQSGLVDDLGLGVALMK
jgi:hypothetical protein